MQVFSLFDRKLREYGNLVLANNAQAVRRGLVDGVRGSNSLVEKHPEDFDLMEIGFFDTDAGVIVGNAHGPVLVDNVATLLSSSNGNGAADAGNR